jgi:hypothetical protein
MTLPEATVSNTLFHPEATQRDECDIGTAKEGLAESMSLLVPSAAAATTTRNFLFS